MTLILPPVSGIETTEYEQVSSINNFEFTFCKLSTVPVKKSRRDDITIEKYTIETNMNLEWVTLEKAMNNAFSLCSQEAYFIFRQH